KLFNQGIVYKGGVRMSKSHGNTITQDEISKKYGIDTARLFLMFVSNPESDMEWNGEGIEGASRFVRKICSTNKFSAADERIEHHKNKFIKEISIDIENFKFNIALIKLMKWFEIISKKADKKSFEAFLKLLHPFCPHITEEIWHKIGNKSFISLEKWPVSDETKINLEFEKEDELVDKVINDVNNVKKIIIDKGKEPSKLYLYVIPNEKEVYVNNIDEIGLRTGLKVKIFSVADKDKHDPEKKSSKAKPGKPGIYLE
ncbi:MAG: class I tRNA ligase family protein, partial [Candidatus Pacearchaeota archaeon]